MGHRSPLRFVRLPSANRSCVSLGATITAIPYVTSKRNSGVRESTTHATRWRSAPRLAPIAANPHASAEEYIKQKQMKSYMGNTPPTSTVRAIILMADNAKAPAATKAIASSAVRKGVRNPKRAAKATKKLTEIAK